MSRLFAKRFCLAPLLAAKQSPRFIFPARRLMTSANLYSAITPKAAQYNEPSSNTKTEKPFTFKDEPPLFKRASKLADRAHSSDDRSIESVKDFATISVAISRDLGGIGARMEAGFAKHEAEMHRNMVKMPRNMRKIDRKISGIDKRLHKVEDEGSGRQVKAIWVVLITVSVFFAGRYPGEFGALLEEILTRITPTTVTEILTLMTPTTATKPL